jgi:hypothetical protein
MSTASASTLRTPPRRLIDQVNHLKSTLARDQIQLTDMSRSGSLETGLSAGSSGDSPEFQPAGPVSIVRLEGRIAPRRIDVAPPGTSRFRFFLDGSQKTIPTCRIGLAPVVVALSAAGILERDDTGQPRLRGDSLRVNQSWIAPLESGNAELDRMIAEIVHAGGDVRDPFTDRFGNPVENYHHLVGDYGRTLTLAFDLAGVIRGEQETALIEHWRDALSAEHPDHWIVIDGPLRGNVPNAIGLVKNLQTQQLANDEAIALFDLPQGYRTTAFRYASNTPDADQSSTGGKTIWYMRLWSATGMDARHSLVRVEAANEISSADQIDEISSWILAERLPRATDDPRWPTLLYPIYYLERILKRRLADITSGWPST